MTPSSKRRLVHSSAARIARGRPVYRSSSITCDVITAIVASAPACVMNAINDALRPLRAKPLTDMSFTPGKILRALGKV